MTWKKAVIAASVLTCLFVLVRSTRLIHARHASSSIGLVCIKAEADEVASEKHYYVRVSKKDHYYQTLIVPIFLTDPYIVVIADRGRGEREGETLSWSEGEERERGIQVWGEGNKTQKSVEGGSVAEKHATFALISSRYAHDMVVQSGQEGK